LIADGRSSTLTRRSICSTADVEDSGCSATTVRRA